MTFHPEALGRLPGSVLRRTGQALREEGFYLGGGTAIAIHLGHRRSVDLDWFTEAEMDPLALAARLRSQGISLVVQGVASGTLNGAISRVRTTFLEYHYPLLQPLLEWHEYHCALASLDDLACMKLSAVAQRGARKDFVDIYALATRHTSLVSMLELYKEKYGITDTAHVLYGLGYFDEADREPMPRMLWDLDWRTVKAALRQWVLELTR